MYQNFILLIHVCNYIIDNNSLNITILCISHIDDTHHYSAINFLISGYLSSFSCRIFWCWIDDYNYVIIEQLFSDHNSDSDNNTDHNNNKASSEWTEDDFTEMEALDMMEAEYRAYKNLAGLYDYSIESLSAEEIERKEQEAEEQTPSCNY